jgi:hypothetical protein
VQIPKIGSEKSIIEEELGSPVSLLVYSENFAGVWLVGVSIFVA